MNDIRETDWEKKLLESDIVIKYEDDRELKLVLLSGLQRLAREAGIFKSHCQILNPGHNMVQCIYSVEFRDGSQWTGTADCNANNTDGKFKNYPTAVAESRAKARCLKDALGIRMLAFEELGSSNHFEVSLTQKADTQQIKAIEKLCESRGVQVAEVLENVIEDKERADSIVQLSELSVAEAQQALAWLNKKKKGKDK